MQTSPAFVAFVPETSMYRYRQNVLRILVFSTLAVSAMYLGACAAKQPPPPSKAECTQAVTTSPQNFDPQTLPLLKECAATNDKDAHRTLGWVYWKGVKIPTDTDQALIHFEQAAALGDPHALEFLSIIYQQGMRVETDMPRAIQYLEQRAHAGDLEAAEDLGYLYLHDKRIDSDPEKSIAWYEHAAQQEHPHSLYALGRLYTTGEFVPPNHTLAIAYLQRAAQQKHPGAMAQLAYLYSESEHIEHDLIEAYTWAHAATLVGMSRSATPIDALEPRLNAQETVDAREAAETRIR